MQKFLKKILVLVGVVFCVVPGVVGAVGETTGVPGGILPDVSGTEYVQNLPQVSGEEDFFSTILPRVIKLLLAVVSILAFVSFLYSGTWLIIFGDKEEDIENMKRNLVYSVVGLAIAGLAYSIVSGILTLPFE